ncbi:MAG: CDP-alcohol phosphatidyltransferase family protein [Caulobacteraceae bacterium]
MSIASDDGAASAQAVAAPGRPSEIEAPSNLYLVHPVSRALVDRLARTAVTPNQVSAASVLAAGAAATSYVALPWPLNAFAGLAFQFLWHVLDGADGDLARRTGRASPLGELVDGVCDHVSQGLIYIAFALMAQRALGGWAWGVAAAAAASHFLQANAYETGRKTYRRYVYGAAWMRQAGPSGPGAALARLYLAVSGLVSPGETAAERALEAVPADPRATLYRAAFRPLIKTSGILDSNTRTLAAFLAVLIARPLWFFLFELTALNLALVGLALWRARVNAALVRGLTV